MRDKFQKQMRRSGQKKSPTFHIRYRHNPAPNGHTPRSFEGGGSSGDMGKEWEGNARVDVPVPIGPKRVLGLLGDIDIHRVRTGDPPSMPQIANVRRW